VAASANGLQKQPLRCLAERKRDQLTRALRPSYARDVKCYCCGEERDEAMAASLLCHDKIKVCRICVGWLMKRTGGIDVTPTLPVVDMAEAVQFWEAARLDVELYDDGFAFVHLNDQSVFDLDLCADVKADANHSGCYIITADVDDWHAPPCHGRFTGLADGGHAVGDA
jgi:hypothetical protein